MAFLQVKFSVLFRIPLTHASSHNASLCCVLHDSLSATLMPAWPCSPHLQHTTPNSNLHFSIVCVVCLNWGYLTLYSLKMINVSAMWVIFFEPVEIAIINHGPILAFMATGLKLKIILVHASSQLPKQVLCQEKISRDSSVTDCMPTVSLWQECSSQSTQRLKPSLFYLTPLQWHKVP